jgi:WD40 repeat protein
MRERFHAFISYSHAVDSDLAEALERALHRFAKPLLQLRALHVFRDKSSLSASPNLWHTIEAALGQSEHFILLASPEAARSPWIQREIQWWIEQRSVDTLLIVLTGGQIAWDDRDGDFDWTGTDALPESLRRRFAGQPLYVDLRWARGSRDLSLRHSQFRAAVLDLAAPLSGKPKEELDSQDVRQYRKARNLRWLAIGAVVAGAVVAGWFAYVAAQRRQETAAALALADERRKQVESTTLEATSQREKLERNSQILLSQQLSGNSTSLLTKDADLSLLIAVEATVRSDTFEARKALFSGLSRLWGVERFLHLDGGQVVGVSFGPNQRLVALVREAIHDGRGRPDGSVLRVWDLRTRRQVGQAIREPPTAAPESLFPFGPPVRFSANGTHFARAICQIVSEGGTRPDGDSVRSCSGQVEIYRLTDNGPVTERTIRHPAWVEELAFGVDAGLLIAKACRGVGRANTCIDRQAGVVHLASGNLESLKGFTPSLQHLAVSSGGIVARSEQRTITLSDKTGSTFKTLEIAENVEITMMAFGAGERLFAVGTGDGRIFLRRLSARGIDDVWSVLHGHGSLVSGLNFSEDGERLISSSVDGTVLTHRVSQAHNLGHVLGTHPRGTTAVAFNPDGQVAITGGWDGTINLWRNAGATQDRTKLLGQIYDGLRSRVECLAFSPDGSLIASISREVHAGTDVLHFWNAQTRRPMGNPVRVEGSSCDAFRPDSRQIALARYSEAFIVDVQTRRQVGEVLPCCGGWIAALAFTTGGARLISVGMSGEIVAWDFNGARAKITRLADLRKTVASAVLDPQRGRLALGGTDGPSGWVSILDVATGRQLLTLPQGRLKAIAKVSFHPTEPILAIGTKDGAIFLWDLRQAELVGEPLERESEVSSLAVNPDGKAIVAGYTDGLVISWSLDVDRWRSLACAIANRALTENEWRRFVGDTPYRPYCTESNR